VQGLTGQHGRGRGFGRAGRAACVALALVAAACSSNVPQSRAPLAPPSEKTAIGPGDVFTLQIIGEKDLPQEYQVASDGTADLPFLQTVQVAGLEPQDIARVVRAGLIQKQILTNPIVIVQVKEYHSRTVILLGQVAKPGSFPLTPGLTLMQALSLAGGLSAIADDDKVTLSRKYGNKTRTVRVSVDAITDGRAEDVPLQAGDRIYVYQRLF